MKPDEKVVFCQIDAHLDTNPKIRRAGRDGRDIFEFLLRRVAIGRTNGTVPLKYIETWYLADQLMMSELEARNGLERAVTAQLINIDKVIGVVRIVGWSEEWGRKPKDGATRTREWRLRGAAVTDVTSRDDVSSQAPHESRESQDVQDTNSEPSARRQLHNENGKANGNKTANHAESYTRVTLCDEPSSHVTVGDESDVGEEKRGEEIYRSAPAAPSPKAKRSRSSKPRVDLPLDWTPRQEERDEAAQLGVNCDLEAAKFRDYQSANGKSYVNHDAAFRNWLRNAQEYSRSRNGVSSQAQTQIRNLPEL